MLMNLKNRNAINGYKIFKKQNTPSKKKKKLKAFQNIVIFKINSIDSSIIVFICRAFRAFSHSLLISCAIILVFSTRIFRNLDLGIEWVFRYGAMELESLRYIVSCLGRAVVVRPTQVLFSLETQSPKGHSNIYTTFVLARNSVEGEKFLEIIRLEV